MYDPTLGTWTSEDPTGASGSGDNLYQLEGSGPADHVDPTGLYDESGHFWTTYMVAIAAGRSKDQAYRLAYYSQLPDQVPDYDAVANGEKVLAEREALTNAGGYMGKEALEKLMKQLPQDEIWAQWVYNWQHSLHGGGPAQVTQRRTALKTLIQSHANGQGWAGEDWAVGLLIHAYGDAYAHVDAQGVAYGYIAGHLRDRHAPDIIASNVPKYDDYIDNLYEALGGTNPGGNTLLSTIKTRAAALPNDDKVAIAMMKQLAQTPAFGYSFAYDPSVNATDTSMWMPNRTNMENVWSLIEQQSLATPVTPARPGRQRSHFHNYSDWSLY